MITINPGGRLGNAMIKNCVASIFSKKFNIKVKSYLHEERISVLNPKFHHEGENIFEKKIVVDNWNFEKLLRSDKIDNGLRIEGFCQSRRFVLNYEKQILENFDLIYNRRCKKDIFVHVRLGDRIQENVYSSLKYYTNAIERVDFRKGYLSSDSMNHEIVSELINKYKLIPYVSENPAEVINFAKDFNNLVLSKGTFSWWIGFLSRARNIFYPTGEKRWHGNIFVFKKWTPIDINNI